MNLDFGFDVQTAVLSTELNVDRNLVYLLFVDADVHVEGAGWPGSLADAKLSVGVPFSVWLLRLRSLFSSPYQSIAVERERPRTRPLPGHPIAQ